MGDRRRRRLDRGRLRVAGVVRHRRALRCRDLRRHGALRRGGRRRCGRRRRGHRCRWCAVEQERLLERGAGHRAIAPDGGHGRAAGTETVAGIDDVRAFVDARLDLAEIDQPAHPLDQHRGGGARRGEDAELERGPGGEARDLLDVESFDAQRGGPGPFRRGREGRRNAEPRREHADDQPAQARHANSPPSPGSAGEEQAALRRGRTDPREGLTRKSATRRQGQPQGRRNGESFRCFTKLHKRGRSDAAGRPTSPGQRGVRRRSWRRAAPPDASSRARCRP